MFSKPKRSIAWDAMKYVNLGRTGLKVSPICVGTMAFGSTAWQAWTIDEQEGRKIVQRALELGINFFDTADVYSQGLSEEILGKSIRDFANRSDVVIATKVNGPMGPSPNDRGLSRRHLFAAIDASLKRLETDYVDLYYIHRWDYGTPVEETLDALNDIVRSGKVRYLGASSMFAWQFASALHLQTANRWARFVAMQNHFNLVYREEEREMLPLCQQHGIGVLPWSPLARGLLTGNRVRSQTPPAATAASDHAPRPMPGVEAQSLRAKTDEYARRLYAWDQDLRVAERCQEVARNRGVPPSHVALAWLLQNPLITAPVVGPRRVEHLDEAVQSISFRLEPAEIQLLEELYIPHPVLGHEGPPR